MSSDLARTPSLGNRVQMCGDAHVGNFGVFATPERDQVFDADDFDETLPGPWEWDVKRLAASLVLVARQAGLGRAVARRSATIAVRSYRASVRRYSTAPYLDTWYSHLDLASVSDQVRRLGRRVAHRAVRKARSQTALRAFPRMTTEARGRIRIVNNPPLIEHFSDPADAGRSRAFFTRYLATLPDERRMLLERYHVADAAEKVVGVGSVGTLCFILLLLGDRDVLDPVFLQVKQALPSAHEPFAGASPYENHAERVVSGQRLIQEASDVFLGWSRYGERDFYVRQLRDMRFSFDLAEVGTKGLFGHAELCGASLARAHARTGDAAAIAGYLGNRDVFDRAVATFAESYADQTRADHNALLAAIQRGTVPATVGS